MILLFDIGNTHTHLGLAGPRRILKQTNIPTAGWFDGTAEKLVEKFIRRAQLAGVSLCSVVPRATPRVRNWVKHRWNLPTLELSPKTVTGVRINYPKPRTIGPDR